MYTANTMSSAIEALGMSLPYSSTMAAEDDEKAESADESRRACWPRPIRADLRPRQILTREAFENAIAVVMARRRLDQRGPAPARDRARAGVPLALDDFERIRARVPVLCDLKPSGRYVATDLHRVGRRPAGDEDAARARPAPRRRARP